MNVSLTPKLEELVRRKVASGLYNNASEVVREALRLLFEREEGRSGAGKDEVRAKIAALEASLREKGVRSLALFGSVVRGEAGPASDVDVLIDIDPKYRFSLVDLVSVKNLLEAEIGRDVDVLTRDGVDPLIRDRVQQEAEKVF